MRGPANKQSRTTARWATLATICALLSAPAQAGQTDIPLPEQSPFAGEKRDQILRAFGKPGVAYLESLKGLKGYKAPSELDPRFTMAFFVNASARGPQAQRMWMLQRDQLGGTWRVAMWDKRYWRRKGLPANLTPPYSWLVSTGRHYKGDRKSGPTPSGVYTIDERKYRLARGYTIPGMINVTYLDLHYSSGRRSGVAFHGTTRSKYRRLGRIDSHGCIRMTQPNALALINRMTGRDKVLSEPQRWGSVPRFWKTERNNRRYGYTRDGTTHPIPESPLTTASAAPVANITDTTRFPNVLTKDGYRAIVVIFRD